ncbi:MAG: 50S ribosomal protein L3 [bacterium ADurb.Bin400]|nr:MAG: 50S ribosomal protein L3 [bacterium ADurb.Bin400]
MKFILGRKIGMTRVFDEDGRSIAVTKIAALACVVSQTKTKDKDGYKAVQIKALKEGNDKAAKVTEFHVDAPGRYKVGQNITLSQFKKDELVSVQGKSKGKGFSGTVKRHDFARGPETHGSNNVREPGSIGGGYPQRVVLGRKMPGHMGNETVTVKNLKVIDVDKDFLLIAGAIPGPVKSIVKVFGTGEVAEEEIDTAAQEELAAMEKMAQEDVESEDKETQSE